MEESVVMTAEDVSGISIQYVVVSTEDPYIPEKDFKTVYSLLVIGSYGDGETDSVFVYDVSRTRQRALEISRLMCDNKVTPCTVLDLLDDIL